MVRLRRSRKDFNLGTADWGQEVAVLTQDVTLIKGQLETEGNRTTGLEIGVHLLGKGHDLSTELLVVHERVGGLLEVIGKLLTVRAGAKQGRVLVDQAKGLLLPVMEGLGDEDLAAAGPLLLGLVGGGDGDGEEALCLGALVNDVLLELQDAGIKAGEGGPGLAEHRICRAEILQGDLAAAVGELPEVLGNV